MNCRKAAPKKSCRHWTLLALAVLLLAVPAFAHSPFGSSTRAVLATNHLEIRITIGEPSYGLRLEVARQAGRISQNL